MGALGKLWACGVRVDWQSFHEGEQRNRVPLPTYPFERTRYWIEPRENSDATETKVDDREDDISKWFYGQTWKRSPLARRKNTREPGSLQCSVLFCDGLGISEIIARSLQATNVDCVIVNPGDDFQKSSEGRYSIDPTNGQAYSKLLKTI